MRRSLHRKLPDHGIDVMKYISNDSKDDFRYLITTFQDILPILILIIALLAILATLVWFVRLAWRLA